MFNENECRTVNEKKNGKNGHLEKMQMVDKQIKINCKDYKHLVFFILN